MDTNSDMAEFMELAGSAAPDRYAGTAAVACSSPQPIEQPAPYGGTGFSQWAVMNDGRFTPVGPTVERLPAGAYRAAFDRGQMILTRAVLVTDELMRFPDTAGERVLLGIQKFWGARDKFKRRGQLFKRGVLLWGPPGSGKTTTVMLLIEDLVERGGIVLLCADPGETARALEQIRRVEPERPIICVMEDVDKIIDRYGEPEMLSLLDGESQVGNVVFVATTNYPEKLAKQFSDRPSRFDEIIKVDMPGEASRRRYLRNRVSAEEVPDAELARWVADTDGLSLAHLRELVVAVFCLDRPYDETLTRLKHMRQTPRSDGDRVMGLAPARRAPAPAAAPPL